MKPGASRALVAMSGGVDSSVAACLLKEQGYDLLGVFMRLGAERYEPATDFCGAGFQPGADASSGPQPPADLRSLSLPIAPVRNEPLRRTKGCCSAADASDARAVAARLGIPFYALNFEQDFDRLIDYFVDEYAAARTPNPCVRCNQWLKFGRLVAYADAIGADWIATGHYARIERGLRVGEEDRGLVGKGFPAERVRQGILAPAMGLDRPRLLRAACAEKDQSYVLFGIAPDVLRRTLFPLGEMTKAQVRAHARRFGLALHDKPESQDICFVPDGDYARLVRARRAEAFRSGEIRHVDGRVVGDHSGVANFTIGQRRGLGVAMGEPVYVTDLDAATATVTIGPREAVLTDELRVTGLNWLCDPPPGLFRTDVQIRYHHQPAAADVIPLPDGSARVVFDEPQSAVTPGQAAVFYDGDEVLGGGWIER